MVFRSKEKLRRENDLDLYREIINQFNIKTGDRIWLSSEVIKYALLFKKKGGRFEASLLLEAFQEAVGEEGTLLLPTFCWDFSNKQKYDYLHSKGNAGVLGNVALQRPDFKRTKHPMHSFAAWGKDQETLCSMDNKHAFGEDSPFGYCRANNVKQIMLGVDYIQAMTFVHYAETMCRVPYRFAKSFTGIYVTEKGVEEERTYDYAARRLDVGTQEEFNRIGIILEERGIACKVEFEGIVSHVAMLGDSYDVICDDIWHNMCRNIYDFSVPREELFKEYGDY